MINKKLKYAEEMMLHNLLFIAILFIVNHQVHGIDDMNNCESSMCGSKGLVVRFPFRIKEKQPDHCGYPLHWFDLSCSRNNHTVLQLTPSWNLTITSIDYASQVISAYDSQSNCLPKRLLSSSLSLMPFQFIHDNDSFSRTSYDYTLFNCSREFPNESEIPCLSNVHYKVYAVLAYVDVDEYMDLFMSCIKMHDILSVPYDYFYSKVNVLQLTWYNPDCKSCEAKGGQCRLQSNSKQSSQTECYGEPKPGVSIKFIATGVTLGSILLVGAAVLVYRLNRYTRRRREYESKINKFLDNYKSFKPTRFSYAHIKRMTNGFEEKLGEGAYGTVFRGKLSNEIMVAVKLLNNSKGNGEEFVNEVRTIGRIHHVNVVRLVGYCADGFRRALVYEYLPNDSLQKFISSPDTTNSDFLGWKRLEDIALGTAKGIEYLHQGCDQRILHFDIKPQNILLDQDFNPKISDFGLAKLCGKDQSAVSMTTAKGTIGYMAPEVFSRNFGNVSYKSDVYSFGMLVLEMVGGRKIVEDTPGSNEQIYFPEWIYNLLEEGEDLRLEIEEDEDIKIAKKLAIVGLWCIQWNPVDRPSMKTVVKILEAEGENLTIPPNPFHSEASARTNTKLPRRRLQLDMEIIVETE